MVWRDKVSVGTVLLGFKEPLLRVALGSLEKLRDVFLVGDEQALLDIDEVEIEFVLFFFIIF